MHLLQGTIQRYAWGTTDAIPRLLQRQADGTPQAEYWLGSHHLGPARVGGVGLDELIAKDPSLLGDGVRQEFGDQLPFLMKVLSARHALSLQVHPSREQAERGYAREEAAGVPLNAPERVYSDRWPKPEMLIALEPFETLCGFRDPLETVSLLTQLGVATALGPLVASLTQQPAPDALRQAFFQIFALGPELSTALDAVVSASRESAGSTGPVGDLARTVLDLDATHPGDPGLLAALLLNRVTLNAGQAVFVPAGQMHTHLRGTGIEAMASSDNVIRGGLTPKHVDLQELVAIVDFEPTPPRVLSPLPLRPGLATYGSFCPEFEAWQINTLNEPVLLPGEHSARTLLVTEGSVGIRDASGDALSLRQGEAVFLQAGQRAVATSDHGLAFLCASGPDPSTDAAGQPDRQFGYAA